MEIELAVSVLKWWSEHRYDTTSNGEDELNVYDDTPEFVIIAEKIAAQQSAQWTACAVCGQSMQKHKWSCPLGDLK